MNILSNLHSALKLAASDPPSTKDEIKDLLEFSPIPVPEEYLQLIQQGSEMEIGVDLGSRGYWFIRIYGASGAIEMNKIYEVQKDLTHVLAIGDNEGGDMLIVAPHASPPGIYRNPMACLSDMDSATFIASNLTELLVEGRNLSLVF
jgi:hypothetical protein